MFRHLLLSLAFFCFSHTAMAQSEGSALVALENRDATKGWEGVGRLDDNEGGFCTATLIRDRLLLTAAHCVYDQNNRLRPPSDFTFQANLRNGRAEATRAIVRIVPHPDFVSERPLGMRPETISTDIAVLELAQAIRLSSVRPFAIAPRPSAGDQVAILSYGRNRAAAPSLQESCSILGPYGDQGAIAMNCNVVKGSSGSPVFRIINGQARIVSVVSANRPGAPQGHLSFGTSLQGPLQMLLAEFAARGPAKPGGEQRLIRFGERNDTGAKFIGSSRAGQ